MSTGGTKTRRFFIFPSLSRVPKVNLAAGAAPSLPAGINTDDSDPLGPDRGNVPQCRYRGRREPPFRGGSLSSSRIFLYRHYGIRIVGGKQRKIKEFKEYGDVPPHAF